MKTLNDKKYVVWVGGIEVNDYLLTKEEAKNLAYEYESEDYEDVIIEKIK
jgi:hypothetical protein